MIFRLTRQKEDPRITWNRPDRPFFAAGACHILAAVFLETYPDAGYSPFFILPGEGFRGSHVFVSDGRTVFDYHGYSPRDLYLRHFAARMRRFFTGWQAHLLHLKASPDGEAFCREHRHRLPEQFFGDPRPRARNYLRRFGTRRVDARVAMKSGR
jgi:hypothetical protein